eukprot:scaffold99238_cov67-Phaeocystis_antarctica.AAC.4
MAQPEQQLELARRTQTRRTRLARACLAAFCLVGCLVGCLAACPAGVVHAGAARAWSVCEAMLHHAHVFCRGQGTGRGAAQAAEVRQMAAGGGRLAAGGARGWDGESRRGSSEARRPSAARAPLTLATK